MKKTGVFRRIDDLGRIVIPKEIRNNQRIKSGDSLEIYIENDNIILKKFSSIDYFESLTKEIVNMVGLVCKKSVFVFSSDKTIASYDFYKNEKLLCSNFLKKSSDTGKINEYFYISYPIISSSNKEGEIVIFSLDKLEEKEKFLLKAVSIFIGKHIE